MSKNIEKNKKKRRFGDRRDGRWVRELSGLHTILPHLMPNRTDAEVYLSDTLDATELMRYLEKRNAANTEYKTTLFHCFVVAISRMINERPLMNRFIQGRRTYQRNDIIISFVAKRRFTDHAEESLMQLIPKQSDTINEISKRIVGDVLETRKNEHATGGVDALLDNLAKIPRPIMMLVGRIIRWLDFWGKNPEFITRGDTNYSTVLLSNLGSIKCPSVYHHLNNYGTNSIVVTIGTLRKEEVSMPDGSKEIRDLVDIGVTLDERIADGFYFARSLKLIQHIFAHPELLEQPLSVPSGFDYK